MIIKKRRPAPGRKLGLHSPPGRVFNGLVAAAALLFLWAATYPVFELGYAALAVLAWAALAVVWFLRGVFLAWYSVAGRLDPIDRSRRFIYAPAMVLGAVLLAASALPLQVRFTVSRPFLSDAASDVLIGADVEGEPVGLFRIAGVEVFGESVVFTGNGCGFFCEASGFAHLPNGTDAIELRTWPSSVRLRPLGGNWYAWAG